MQEFVAAHPVLAMVLAGFSATLINDLDQFIAFRKEHPGASYDFVIAVARLLKGALGPIALMLAAAGVQAV